MTINVNSLVNVTPGVEAPGGSNFVLNGLMVTANTRIPIGSVPSFPNQAAVGAALGFSSAEYALAGNYFNSFDTSTKKPGALLMAQLPYNGSVNAYLRGASVTGAANLAALVAITSGNISLNIDGASFTNNSVNLTTANSYSGVAALLQTALQTNTPTLASFTGSITAKNMNVSAVASGVIVPGQTVAGTGVTAGTTVVSQTSGTTGGIGVYVVSTSQTVASGALITQPAAPTVTYDSVSQAFVVSSGSTGASSTISYPTNVVPTLTNALGLSQALGAVLSQGAAGASGTGIAGAMQGILQTARNWAGFMTVFEPVLADKVLFAQWASPLPIYYAMWDTNSVPSTPTDTTSAGYLIKTAGYNGTVPIGADPALGVAPTTIAALAAFVLGTGASIDWTRLNGRTNLAYRTQAGLAITCANDTTAANLIANGYSFYGSYANAGNGWVLFQPGAITGNFAWWDSYVNQIWLNNKPANGAGQPAEIDRQHSL